MTTRRDLLRSVPALLLGTAAAACRPRKAPAASGRLTVVWTQDILSLDPNEKFEYITDTYSMNVFEPLLRFDRRMAYVPVLAKRWDISDGKTWRFTLRGDVTFHDGSHFSADDVVFTLRRVQSRKTSEIAPYLAAITSVRKIDELTVEVESTRPANLLSVLSFVYMLPKGTLERAGEEVFFHAPVGTGPYRFVSRTEGQRLTLGRHETYRGGPAPFAEAVFQCVRDPQRVLPATREAAPALAMTIPSRAWAQAQGDPTLRIMSRPGLTVQFLVLNTDPRPENPLKDPRVRKAMRAALDYETLSKRTLSGQSHPASQFVTQDVFGFDPSLTVPEFVPGRARSLLAEAGHPDGLDLTLNVTTGDEAFVEELSRQLSEGGIRLTPAWATDLEHHERVSRCQGDVHTSGWLCATGDAAELFEGNFYGPTGSTLHGCGYSRPDLDALIDRVAVTLDPTKRLALLQQAMRLVVDDLPWIPLLCGHDRYALTRGVTFEPRADGEVYLADVRPE